MKPDTLKKKKLIAALAMLSVGVLLLYRSLQTPTAAKATIAAPTADPASKVQPHSEHRYIAVLLKPTLDPRLRLDLLAESEGVVYNGAGRNIFVEHQEDIPQPLTSVRLPEKQQLEAPPALPPLPSPPPIDLKAWGWVNHGGGDRTVFLAQGDNGFVAHEGDIVARRYKVVKIGPSSVEIEDLLSNNRQTIPVSF